MPEAPEARSSQESFKDWRNDTFATIAGWLAAYNANPRNRAAIKYENNITPEMASGEVTFYFTEPQQGVLLVLAQNKGNYMFFGEYDDRISAVNEIRATHPGAVEVQNQEVSEE